MKLNRNTPCMTLTTIVIIWAPMYKLEICIRCAMHRPFMKGSSRPDKKILSIFCAVPGQALKNMERWYGAEIFIPALNPFATNWPPV